MARIVLFGGHGKVALLAAPLLVDAGHAVTSVFRNEAHTDEVARTGATPLVADLEQLDTDALTELIDGHDVVVFSAGAGGGSPQRTTAVDRDAAIRTIDAAHAAGAQRYIMVSYLGAGPDHGVDPQNPFFTYAEAKAAADAHLRESSLVWTVLKPAALGGPQMPGTLTVVTDESQAGEGATTARGLVAEVIAAAIDDTTPAMDNADIAFVDGPTPIGEALAAL